MSRFHSYINTAISLIEAYTGDKPFATYIKQFFAANKKYGSRDRRQIAALCYNYFRVGFAGAGMPPREKMVLATFLCETAPSEFLENLQPEWNGQIALPFRKKLKLLHTEFSLLEIFPFINELSDGINTVDFCASFLVQPDLFLRIRPQTKITVLKKLERSKLSWQLSGEDCVRLNNSDKVEELFIVNKEVVIQDYNSQKVLDFLKSGNILIDELLPTPKSDLLVWDCCAASGGKSILLHDIINHRIDLTVSDIRATIILMLHRRFKKAGIKEYKYFIADITSVDFNPGTSDFNLVICDAPCTGSGTWSRTPEQLSYFNPASINEYSILQKKIIGSVVPHLKAGGIFIYITCSVFKTENESIAAFIGSAYNCELLFMELLKGYHEKADTMFVAVFRKLQDALPG